MGFSDAFKKNGRTRISERCEKNMETGEVICTSTRVNSDNTRVELAGFTVGVDANCNATMSSSFENEEGYLDKLEKKNMPKIVGKCHKNQPDEY